MSKIYLELLSKTQIRTFIKLKEFKQFGYLAGGTALALQINHRKSVDFDIFVDKAIGNELHIRIKKVFGDVEYYINSTDQVSFKTADDISITFLWYYFKQLFPPIKTNSLPLATIFDISADKAQTIVRRAIWRDYVDIFFLIYSKIITLEKIIDLAKKKFSGEFVETQFLEQLAYFGDIKELPIDFIGKSYTFSQIKSYLQNEVESYSRKNIVA